MIQGHGDDLHRYAGRVRVNFSSNIWYGAQLSGLTDHLRGALERISSYPEPDGASLSERIAQRAGIAARQVCVTNGATEAFYLIAQAWAGSRSAIAVPSFSEYADACRIHKHHIEWTSIEALRSAADRQNTAAELSGEGLVWLCNPNNPDGRSLPLAQVREWIERFPRRVFVLDHSYGDFTLQPLLSDREAVHYPNVVIVHSMTKTYGIAGLRLGYLTGAEALIDRIASARMPWSVNSLALEAGHYLLTHEEELQLPLADYLQHTRQFRMAMQALEGVSTEPTDCHFFTARLAQGGACDLKDFLVKEHGLLIRDASNFRGYTPSHFRVATQRPEENERLIDALKIWLKAHSC